MKIELKEVRIRELVAGYVDDSFFSEGGVRGYSGQLDIRPPYQREFIYNDKQRKAVIDSIMKGYPLNVMYWSVRDDGTYEIIDGQQRTISIGQYYTKEFSLQDPSTGKPLYFHGLPEDKKAKFLDYKLMVYLCSGTESEKLEWFRIINIAGAKLTDQELRNAVYAGSWVSDAKKYFSKRKGPAYQVGRDYLKGSPIRQEYLETAIRWISEGNIEEYMGQHQHDPNAVSLWNYFQSAVNWIEATFTEKRPIMKGVDWGTLYNSHKNESLDPAKIEEEIKELIDDEDVTKQSGIYPYILTREEKHLNIRQFDDRTKQRVYQKQKGKCRICGESFDIKDMHADHIDPWSKGGKTNEQNCQMLCGKCNQTKSAK